ncbi:MAG TPA: PKD domain-containing protein [Solirubrobacteraceae bacterium]|jgi:hypothetical protein|nr:PKD domain-containing protein [Solirubrobacteraceae bacterium]
MPRSILCCLGACLALGAGLSTSAEAAPAWLPPLDVSTSGVDGLEPQVAVDAAGDTTAVWERVENLQQVVQSAYRPAGGSWQAPVTLSVDAPTEDSFVPQVAMNAEGDTVVVWAHYNGGSEVVEAAYRSAGGGWSAPTIVSPAGNEVPHPVVGIDARGDAIAVWELHTAPANRIEASFRPAGGAWQPPVELSDKTHDARIGLMSMNAAGDAAAVWSLSTGSADVVQVAYRAADGAWQKPVEVSGPEADAPSVALDAHGDARAIWRLKTGANWLVQSAYMPAGGSWQPPVELSPANSTEPKPRIAVDELGDALADWAASDGANVLVEAAIGTPGGAWQSAQKLSAPGHDALDPTAALDAGGNAFAAWERSNGTNELVEASTHPGAGAWQAPFALSATGENASTPALAADAQGNAVAVWERSNGTNQIVQASGFDGAGPALNGLQVPTTGFVGQPLSFSISPLDTWSAVASTGWSFGDGTVAGGATATHAYATPGLYTVTVTSTDALTNATSAARTTTIVVKPQAPAEAPAIAGLHQSHARWRRGGKLASISRRAHRRRVPVGTTFTFRLNETARVSFVFSQAVGGRKVKRRCVAPNRRNRHKRACKRTLVKGTLALSARNGLDKLAFQGRISRTKKLAPGSYTLTLTATNATGRRSRPAKLRFTIVR